jgi:hypothetical protein
MVGTPVSLLVNPIVWGTAVLYLAARIENWAAISSFIERLFVTPVYYAAIVVAVAGNCALLCQKIVTPLKRQQQSEAASDVASQHPMADYLSMQEYGLSARLLLTPLWWAFTSVSAYRAMRKLLIRSQRSAWDKTPHGHALETEARLAVSYARCPDHRGVSPAPRGEERGQHPGGSDGRTGRIDRRLGVDQVSLGGAASQARDLDLYQGGRQRISEHRR